MRPAPYVLAALFAIAAASCSSTPAAPEPVAAEDCTCGISDSELDSCVCEFCIQDHANPSNPYCICGGLATVTLIAGAEGQTGADGVQLASTPDGRKPILQALLLANGRSVEGWVTEDDGKAIDVRIRGGGSTRLEYDQLDTRTIYRLKLARLDDQDPAAQLALADYAASHELFSSALRHYHHALELDATQEDLVDQRLASLRLAASSTQLAQAQEEREAGHLTQAERILTDVVRDFPQEPAAAEAGQMLTEMAAEAQAARIPEQSPDLDKLDPAHDQLARGIAEVQKGQIEGHSPSKALRFYDGAITMFNSAAKKAESVHDRAGDDVSLAMAATELQGTAQRELIASHLAQARLYNARTSYSQAVKACEAAMKIDPENAEAKALRVRIEQDMRDGWWRWGRAGGWGRRRR